MNTKEDWVDKLNLIPHPEGGFYKETYRSTISIDISVISDKLNGKRNLCTGIYFMLDAKNFSAFHRIKSDEMWHFYAGDALKIHMVTEDGNYFTQLIGNNLENGEKLQFVVPANVWFASEVKSGGDYSLVGCTVSFGFDFNDFEMADATFIKKFSHLNENISKLVR